MILELGFGFINRRKSDRQKLDLLRKNYPSNCPFVKSTSCFCLCYSAGAAIFNEKREKNRLSCFYFFILENMADANISDFMSITGCDDANRAKFFLESANNDVNAAVLR